MLLPKNYVPRHVLDTFGCLHVCHDNDVLQVALLFSFVIMNIIMLQSAPTCAAYGRDILHAGALKNLRCVLLTRICLTHLSRVQGDLAPLCEFGDMTIFVYRCVRDFQCLDNIHK